MPNQTTVYATEDFLIYTNEVSLLPIRAAEHGVRICLKSILHGCLITHPFLPSKISLYFERKQSVSATEGIRRRKRAARVSSRCQETRHAEICKTAEKNTLLWQRGRWKQRNRAKAGAGF
ncbi:hypothetical protein NDU88_002140 [Pleurodeles waltl]|uniref:Uncharacterized protein n=1 Tax=Pleurodeles waltl TaxID=8319 RepID=A0AAV7VAC7_PLEWA|nr:hypothetical protein NDU88_002140 [Pleurodeles waltl]